MKVFKFLIKPLEFIVLLGAIAALIYFRSIIFHANVNQHIDSALAYAQAKLDIEIPFHKGNAEKLAPLVKNECESVEAAALIADAQAEVEEVEAEAVVVVDATLADADADVADISVSNEQAIIADTPTQPAVIDEKADQSVDANQASPVVEVVPDPVIEEPAVIEKAEVEAPLVLAQANDLAQADFKASLIKARQSFWSGKTAESERIYLDLVRHKNSGSSIYGELGNVYYAQGKWKQAGEAYYEAAIRLLEQGNKGQVADQVNYLLRVIQGLDTESAEKLKNKIAG